MGMRLPWKHRGRWFLRGCMGIFIHQYLGMVMILPILVIMAGLPVATAATADLVVMEPTMEEVMKSMEKVPEKTAPSTNTPEPKTEVKKETIENNISIKNAIASRIPQIETI